jgi:hypothetical protein
MSVDLKRLIEENGLDAKNYVTTPRWIGSVILIVEDLRTMYFKVGYDPLEKPEPNPYHGQVWGDFNKRSYRKAMQDKARWFVNIPDVQIK